MLVDYRLGGYGKLVFSTRRDLMLVPPELLKCVAFIAYKKNSGFHFAGTVFFVARPLEETDRLTCYAVTARHVIEAIDKRAIDGSSYLRLNTKEHGAQFTELPLSSWTFLDDRSDVAIAPVPMNFAIVDHLLIPVDMFLTDELIPALEIGEGAELFFPGLFVRHHGNESNIPIIRTGNIAAMPREPVKTKMGNMRAYLAEARSIGGFSGSPVFTQTGGARQMARGLVVQGPGRLHHLLGLVHGHYDVRDVADSPTDAQVCSDELERSINMGIAIIIPAQQILAAFDEPQLVAHREESKRHFLEQQQAQLPELD